MGLFFAIDERGDNVYVAKTLFAVKPTEKDFIKDAVRIPANSFLLCLPEPQREKMIKVIEKVKEYYGMNLGILECNLDVFLSEYNTINHYLIVGDESFTYVNGGDYTCGGSRYENIIQYGNIFFGEEFMKKHEDMLHKEGTHYFAYNHEISEAEYKKLKSEQRALLQIVSMNKDIEKEFGKNFKVVLKEMNKSSTKKH